MQTCASVTQQGDEAYHQNVFWTSSWSSGYISFDEQMDDCGATTAEEKWLMKWQMGQNHLWELEGKGPRKEDRRDIGIKKTGNQILCTSSQFSARPTLVCQNLSLSLSFSLGPWSIHRNQFAEGKGKAGKHRLHTKIEAQIQWRCSLAAAKASLEMKDRHSHFPMQDIKQRETSKEDKEGDK